MLFTLDREWRITYLNGTAAVTVGRSPERLTGKVIGEEVPELVDTRLDADRAAARRGGAPRGDSLRVLTRSNKIRLAN